MTELENEMLKALQASNAALSSVLEWQEGFNQPLEDWPQWMKIVRRTIHLNSIAITKADGK